MTDAKSDAVPVEKPDAEDPQRRNLAMALFGVLGGAALLGACAPADGSEPAQLGEVAQALSGTGTLKVVDNVTNLRALTGGTTLWIAAMQGYSSAGDGGGVFYWSTTAKADDGWLVLNAGSGNSAGWRRVNPGFMQFDNVTALRATSGSTKGVAVLTGYSTPGDGGGGTFYWSTVAAPDNGGTIFNSGSGNSVGWRRIYSGPLSLKWFGAVGDGSTADDAAITRALATINPTSAVNQDIYFPPGNYKITATVTPASNASYFRLLGSGKLNSTLQWGGAAGIAMLLLKDPVEVTISNLGFVETLRSNHLPALNQEKQRRQAYSAESASADFRTFTSVEVRRT